MQRPVLETICLLLVCGGSDFGLYYFHCVIYFFIENCWLSEGGYAIF